MQQKIEWVNNLKALGILAVILGHIASPFSSFIFSWHMPLFFIVAGFFIKSDIDFKQVVVKDFKRIMLPYFIFAFIGIVAEVIKRAALHRDELDYSQELLGVLVWMDGQSLINSYAFVLWFLPALFFARLFLVLVNQSINNNAIKGILILSLFALSFYIQLPFAIDNALNGLLFVFIGHIFFNRYQDVKYLYILPVVLIALSIYFGIPSLDMASKTYGNIFVNIIFAIAIIYLFILIFKKINISHNILTLWGGNTMLLFIVHPYTNNIAHILVENFYFGQWYFKLFISLALLQIILMFKNKWGFKYV